MSVFDHVTSKLGGALSGMGGEQAGLLGGLLDLLGKGEGGGLSALAAAFQSKGLGDVVSSWIATGPNLPVSAGQIQEALGSDRIRELATKVGLSPEALSAKLSDILPTAVDKLTPDGKLPEAGVLQQAMDLLRSRRP